ncbi:MAG: prepilin peptidase [Pirellulales bacterium]
MAASTTDLAMLAAVDTERSIELLQWAMWWVLVLWLLAVGGCFGSFMNVVIYRLPAGLSVMRPPSRCPYCLNRIRGRDNIPVISWLVLRGRCRDCGTSVSKRYPVIEAVVAFSCVALALTEVFPGGEGLPNAVRTDLHDNPWQLWTMFSGHVLLLCTLFCATMIQYDDHPVPWRLFLPLAITVLAMSTMVPEACRIRWTVSAPGTWAGNLVQTLMAAGCGAFAGATLSLVTRESDRFARGSVGLGLFLAIVTLFIGWISGLLVAVASGLLSLVQTRVARRYPAMERIPTLAWVTLSTFLLLLAWRWILPYFPLLALDSASSFAVATIVATLLISAAAWWLGPWSPLHWETDEETFDAQGVRRAGRSESGDGVDNTVENTVDATARPSASSPQTSSSETSTSGTSPDRPRDRAADSSV